MDGHHTQTQSPVCDSTDLFSFIFILQRLSRTQQGTSFESGQDEDSGTSWTRRSSSTAKFQTTRTSTTGTGSGHPTLLSITSDDHVRNFSKIFHLFPSSSGRFWGFEFGLRMDGPVLYTRYGIILASGDCGARPCAASFASCWLFHQNVSRDTIDFYDHGFIMLIIIFHEMRHTHTEQL